MSTTCIEIGCLIDGCAERLELYRFAPKGIRGSFICGVHGAEFRALPWGNVLTAGLKMAIYDAPTLILDTALLAHRENMTAADRRHHRRLREERAALNKELRARRQ